MDQEDVMHSDSSDSAPSGEETSDYMRQILKRKRQIQRQFEKENGPLVKLSSLLPTSIHNETVVTDKPPVKRKRASVPVFEARRKSARLSGASPKYYDPDHDEPVLKRQKPYSTTKTPKIQLKKTVAFNVDAVNFDKIYYSSCKKVYSASGTTCHQCRQKTIDVKSHCRSCSAGRGQFCGFCLSKRYGEDVAEVLQNPNWKCPPCRGVCNCSICRRRLGKAPTGQLVPAVVAQGFSSVAEYLQNVGDTIEVDDENEEHRSFVKKEPCDEEACQNNISIKKEAISDDECEKENSLCSNNLFEIPENINEMSFQPFVKLYKM